MVGASGAPSHSPTTIGWPGVSITRPFANASCAPIKSAASRIAPPLAGSPLMLGIARSSVSSATKRSGIDRLEFSYGGFGRIEEAFRAALDESLQPRGPDLLYDL